MSKSRRKTAPGLSCPHCKRRLYVVHDVCLTHCCPTVTRCRRCFGVVS